MVQENRDRIRDDGDILEVSQNHWLMYILYCEQQGVHGDGEQQGDSQDWEALNPVTQGGVVLEVDHGIGQADIEIALFL